MSSIDNMKTYIQEWFSCADNPVEIAKIYHEIAMEAEKQLAFMLNKNTTDEA